MLYFTCERCKIEVEYDDTDFDPEEMLCDDCYIEAHNSIGD
jgi:NMD protein affecting ribosome stability and mRNA decay